MSDRRLIAPFYLRFALYLVAYLVPVFHPAVLVSYDSATVWLWFLFIPLQMHIAFFVPKHLTLTRAVPASAAVILVSVAVVSGFDPLGALFASTQLAAFALTWLLFNSRRIGRFSGIIELAIVSILYVRITGFSRASESLAESSGAITQGVLALTIGAVVLQAIVVYLAVYREGVAKRTLRELVIFAGAATVLGLFVVLLLPPDFVNHQVVLNDLRDPRNPEFQTLDERANGLDGGNLRSDRRPGDRNGTGNEGDEGDTDGNGESPRPRLQGIAAEEWSNRRGRGEGSAEGDGEGEGESKQYAVMVVGSRHDPVYAAEGYFSSFDPERGFVYTPEEPLNDLTYTRLLETWRNRTPALDPLREETEVFFLSSIAERVVPYDPVTIEPTVLNRRYHPFDFVYRVTSAISMSGPAEWRRITPLTEAERLEYAEYLEIDIAEPYREAIMEIADRLFAGRTAYFQRLEAIMALYTSYQYEIGFSDDVSVAAIHRFLLETKTGDCSEFSNATALLARIAGLPSRVVTGYLATDELQTPRHRQGLEILRRSIEPLNSFPIDDLYLVTTAHRHSWVQILMPGYGWVDIETTSTAIPPIGSMDPNAMDVVIPIISTEEIVDRNFDFPWPLVGRTLLVLALSALTAAYLFRFGRRLYLAKISRETSRRALQALYTLMLSHLATEGYPLKSDSDTSIEYAGSHPELREFADRYTELRYRPPRNDDSDDRWTTLRDTFRETKRTTRRSGLVAFVKRIASLRELRY